MSVDLPSDIRSHVKGGTGLWEKAQCAWDMGQSLPEFEDRPHEQQDWLLATWRTRLKISAIEAKEQWLTQKRSV